MHVCIFSSVFKANLNVCWKFSECTILVWLTLYSGLGLEKFVLVFDPTGHTTPARVQANMHGKTRAGVVCFSLERKMDFASPWHL